MLYLNPQSAHPTQWLAFIALFLALEINSVLNAHETWMLPSHFIVNQGDIIRVDLTSGMSFPKNDTAIEPDRIKRMGISQLGKWTKNGSLERSDAALVLSFGPIQSGVSALCVELHPKEIELPDDIVPIYFDEINASQAIRDRWKEMEGKVDWKESYTKSAKTLVRCEPNQSRSSWELPAGLGFELCPLSDPFELKVGSEISVKLLFDGVPIRDGQVGLMVEGSDERHFATTDNNGVAKLRAGKKGKTLLYSVRLSPLDNGTWSSYFTTLTIAVD